ncbi:MAG: saccharopine dehydrogenase NADP-binding domain-containing protein [Desulfobacterales bacterium]|nr:saccharopine dehydrogenase NADP-binding domain-containing protein [Desulfobacterales bacterium]
MPEKSWMIYGANGYTGRLIAEEAVLQGLRPILAGRNHKKIKSLAQRLNLAWRCFDLKNPEIISSNLDRIALLLNCAGPFTATSVPLAKACLKSGTDYLDITGEMEVFEYIHSMNEKAREAGVVLCPGAGFDLIPTDCLAATLKKYLPDANYLALGFDSKGPVSPGTAKTIIEGFKYGGMIRKNGILSSVRLAHKVRKIDFGSGPKMAITISWGDVSTAFYTTGIPNIEVYIALPERAITLMKILRIFRFIISLEPFQILLKKIVDIQIKGPSVLQRKKSRVHLWGEVINSKRDSVQAHLKTANGYDVTVMGALGIVRKLLEKKSFPGVYTPSQLMGINYISNLPGSSPITLLVN